MRNSRTETDGSLVHLTKRKTGVNSNNDPVTITLANTTWKTSKLMGMLPLRSLRRLALGNPGQLEDQGKERKAKQWNENDQTLPPRIGELAAD
jgi:hypothetical protein